MKTIGNYNFWNYDVTSEVDKVAVSLSGGADSALLLYMVALQDVKDIYPYTIRVKDVADGYEEVLVPVKAQAVVDKVRELVPDANIHDIKYYYTDDRNNFIPNYEMSVLMNRDYGITLFTNGATIQPQDEEFISTHGNCPTDKTRYTKRPNFISPNPNGIVYYRPFINFDKRFIKGLYDVLEITESLFPITNSCTQNLKEYDKEPCGKCWWCNEREWAFSSSDSEAGS